MNTDFITLTSLINHAVEHNVDFDVWHDETSHKDKRVKTFMRIMLPAAPTVLVAFNDKSFGQQATHIVLEKNENIKVVPKDLIRWMNWKDTIQGHKRSIHSNVPLFNLQSVKDEVVFEGENCTAQAENLTDSSEKGFYKYQIRVKNFVRDANTEKLYELTPTFVTVQVPEHDPAPYINAAGERSDAAVADGVENVYTPRNMATIPLNTTVKVSGKYHFPDTIDVAGLTY